MKHILYHENNQKHPYTPQEDAHLHSVENGVFVVADGITHDFAEPQAYPMPSDSYEVARIICKEVVSSLADAPFIQESIKQAYSKANKAVNAFNTQTELYKNREKNNYTIGAAVTSMVWIQGVKMLYAVLDDCYISVFSEDLVDHPFFPSYVEKSAKFFDKTPADWSDEDKKMWRKDLRNHKITKDGKDYGYGAIDGREGFEQFMQLGELELTKGDLVCVYTDGFIKHLLELDLIKALKEDEFTQKTYDLIHKISVNKDLYKEKTAYFIKI